MREVHFTGLDGKQKGCCHAGMMSSLRTRRCHSIAYWAVSYIPTRAQAGMPEEHVKYLCTKHAAQFAARHGGGTIDLNLFKEVT